MFDIDYRHGDCVCVRCGTVQNARSIESQEEEHRTFADDDKAESKKRAEVNDGRTGGSTADATLRAANSLANAGKQDKEEKKVDLYKSKVKDLASKMNLPRTIQESACNYCTNYVASQTAHDELCKDSNCRLRQKEKKPDLVATSVLQYALRKVNLGRQFQEFAHHLRDKQEVDAFRTDVGKAFGLIKEHLAAYDKGKAYPCVTGDATVLEADGGEGEQALTQVTSLFPRFCQQLKLPHIVEIHALETYQEWFKQGTRTVQPQTIAAAAILAAANGMAEAMREMDVKELKMADLTRVAGVAEATIRKTLNDHSGGRG